MSSTKLFWSKCAAIIVVVGTLNIHDATAQRWAAQAQAILTTADISFHGVGVGGGVVLQRRVLLLATGNVGETSNGRAARVEVTGLYFVEPGVGQRYRFYLSGGVSYNTPGGRAFIVGSVGGEWRVLERSSLFGEIGAGGGVRLVLGWRLRGG